MISTFMGGSYKGTKAAKRAKRRRAMADEDRISRYQANLDDEQNSAYLYRVLADVEPDERLSRVYRRLAETEEKHLRFWEERLREAGDVVPERQVGWRTRVLGWLAKRFGPQFVLPTIDTQSRTGRNKKSPYREAGESVT
jgi:hypothetical protein